MDINETKTQSMNGFKRIILYLAFYIYNPYYRVYFIILVLMEYILFSYKEGSLILQLLYILFYVLLIFGVCESIIEVLTKQRVNKKQANFLQNGYLIIGTFPLAIPLVSKLIGGDIITPFTLIISSFLIFSILIKFTNRYISIPFIFTYIFIISLGYFGKIELPLIINSVLISNLILIFGVRYTQLNPKLRYENKIIDEFIDKRKDINNKLKGIKVGILESPKETILFKDKFYFIKNKKIWDETNTKIIDSDLIKDIFKLIKVKENLEPLYINNIKQLCINNIFKKFKKLSYKDRDGLKTIKRFETWCNKILSKNIPKQEPSNLFRTLGLTFFSIVLFNEKAMRIISKWVIEDYDNFSKIYKGDDIRLWKSDLKTGVFDYLNEDIWYILILLNYFISVPSDDGLEMLKSRVKIAFENCKNYKYKGIVDPRNKIAQEVYNNKQIPKFMIDSFLNLKKSTQTIIKLIKSINTTINSSPINKGKY